MGGLGARRARDRAARARREGPLVQPAVAPADRVRRAARRCRHGEGTAGHERCAAVHRRLPRHDHDRAGPGAPGPAPVGGGPAPVQPAAAGVHHAVRAADPVRPPTAVLDPAQHPRPGLVPGPEARPDRPAVDRQAGQHQPARQRRAPGFAALDRAGPLVASGQRHAVAAQRAGVLRPAVQHRPVAPSRPHELGRLSQRRVCPDPVPVAELAGRERLCGVQQPAADRVLHHRVPCSAARIGHRPGDVTGAVDPVQARVEGPEHPDRPLAALSGVYLVPAVHRAARDVRGDDGPAAQPQPHLHRHRQPRLARVRAVHRLDGRSDRGVGCRDAVHVAAPADRPTRRVRPDRAGTAAVRAPRRHARGVHRGRPQPVLLAQRRLPGLRRLPRAAGRWLRRLPAADQRPGRAAGGAEPRGPARPAGARADHAALLHPGLVGHRQVARGVPAERHGPRAPD